MPRFAMPILSSTINFLVVEQLARVSDVNSECPNGDLPLYLAVIGGDINKIEALTEADADASALHSDGNPLLYHAILLPSGYNEVRYLIRGGADVNAIDAQGNTLLSTAVEKDDLNIIDALIDGGAGQAPICNAIALR